MKKPRGTIVMGTNGDTVYTVFCQGGMMTAEVCEDGAFAATTEGIKSCCIHCDDSDCMGTCDEFINNSTVEDIEDYHNERLSDEHFNLVVDGFHSMFAQLCSAGLICKGRGFDNQIDINDLAKAISLTIEGAAENVN